MTLFDQTKARLLQDPDMGSPLADRMRPKTLEEFVGQEHLVGKGKVLREIINKDSLSSIILWGPPGSGKTTLARIIALKTQSKFISFSAVTSGIRQIKDIMEIARHDRQVADRKTILFIDEIHRFNKAQQDAFLPFVEKGIIILIGATTENPSFEVNSALLSRTKTFVLEKLSPEYIRILVSRALKDKERGLGKYNIKTSNKVIDFISSFSDGDARIAYNILEMAVNSLLQGSRPDAAAGRTKAGDKAVTIGIPLIENIIQKKALLYDKAGEEHFNIISALHKSLRGSDPDGAVYWIVRMLESGEDPLYIIRRMVRFASEDIGLAAPNALQVAVAAKHSFEFIGPPEGYLAIIQAAVYMALCPKSNSLYTAYKKAKTDVDQFGSLPVPYHIRNAPTGLMKDIGYGKGYKYDHEHEDAIADQDYLPEKLLGKKYYKPDGRGFEKELLERLNKIAGIRKNKK